MNRSRLLCIFAVLLAVQAACLSATATPAPTRTAPVPLTGKTPPDGPIAASQPIGSITQLHGGVKAGPESALEVVSPLRDLFDNDAAQVFDHGKARMDFGYGITFTLYNDTVTGGTSVAASNQVKAKLAQGGLLGYNPPGARTEVQLANKGSVIILGTTYFILYDPVRGIAWVFNFDGTVNYSVGGGDYQSLPRGSLVLFDRSRVLESFSGLRFSAGDFDRYATQFDSAVLGLEALLKDLQPPVSPTPPPTESFTASPPTQPPVQVSSLRGTINQLANCRYGPGAPYLYKYGIKKTARMEVIGRDADGNWLKIQAIGGHNPCWINADLIDVEGDVMQVADAYPSTNGLPISPFFEKIAITSISRDGGTVTVQWAEHTIRSDLVQPDAVEYIVEVWTCMDGKPGFYALGTNDTSASFQIDESCGAASHADVIGQDKEGFSPPAVIDLP
ncbi:MAG: hypothetical protein ACM3QS_07020 [Bacteroidota bacterium]